MPDRDPISNRASAGTQSLQRAIALLKIVAVNNRNGIRLSDLHRRAGLERPTVYRLLQGMAEAGLVRQDTASKCYFLGTLTYELGLAATPKVALRDICWPYLEALADCTGDTVFMTIRSGFDGICVARAEGSFPIKMHIHDVGRHRPLNVGSSGMAILSALPDDEINRICLINVERTKRKNPRYSEALFRESIERTRRRGYAFNKVLDEPPVFSVGMPIYAPDGTPAAGISLSTLSSRLENDRLEWVLKCMADAVKSIEEELLKKFERDRIPYAMPSIALGGSIDK